MRIGVANWMSGYAVCSGVAAQDTLSDVSGISRD